MPLSRRHLLAALSAAPYFIFPLDFIVPLASLAGQNPTERRPDGSQDASNGEGPHLPPNANKTLLEERQKNIKKDVEKLYDLASQLKSEVEKTDSTTVLSLAMLKKAEEIEKLARQIKDRTKG